MKAFFSILAISLCASFVLFAADGATDKSLLSFPNAILENEILRLEFLPTSLGRLNRIFHKPSGVELLLPRISWQVVVDPVLFIKNKTNAMGCCEFFWGSNHGQFDGQCEITSHEKEKMVFNSDSYGVLGVKLKRQVVLPADCSSFSFESVVTLKEGQRFLLRPWFNVVPVDHDRSFLRVPLRGGVKENSLGACHYADASHVGTGRPGILPPARNWMATVYPDQQLIFAIMIPDNELFPDGSFYTWWGMLTDGKSCKTMDVIYNAKQLGSGENYPFSIKFMIFSGLTNIRELAGNTAVDCTISKKDGQREIEMRFATSCYLPEGEFKLKINGKITHQIQMPALRPGNTFTCSFACPALADKCEIGGILPDGTEFTLLDAE